MTQQDTDNNENYKDIIKEKSNYIKDLELMLHNKEKQDNGICNCKTQCNGKGKNGFCKKITVAVFNSGKIIITGGQ